MVQDGVRVVGDAFLEGKPSRLLRDARFVLAVRLAVLLAAAAVFYWRTPETFTNPQFWGEDAEFFSLARIDGWSVLLTTMAGYRVTIQFLVGVLASYFSPVYAPAIFNYTAVALTLLVVWLVTSPRLDLPAKPLAALAVVLVPMGYEELGTITNIQWILPIGAFAILFMRRSTHRLALVGEGMFLFLMAVSGPFSVFFSPLFVWRVLVVREPGERRRLIVLAGIVCFGALIQVLTLLAHTSPSGIEASPYPWTLWVNLPFRQIATVFGPASTLFDGIPGLIIGLLCMAAAAVLALRRPFVTQKLFMCFLTAVIVTSGMWKFRDALGTQVGAQRYFYAGSIFLIWFILCLPRGFAGKIISAIFVLIIEILLLPTIYNSDRIPVDLEWSSWARHMDSGLPMMIPTWPMNFSIIWPAKDGGPLERFAPWLGRRLDDSGDASPAECLGGVDLVAPVSIFRQTPESDAKPLWNAVGRAWGAADGLPVELVVIADQSMTVVGFGFPGFASAEGPKTPPGAGWMSYFHANPGDSVRAYGIMDMGQRICSLAGVHSLDLIEKRQSLVTGLFAGGVEIVPGREVVQRFAPESLLSGVPLQVQLVTWGREPSDYEVHWRVVQTQDNVTSQIGSGILGTGAVLDWQVALLQVDATRGAVPDEIAVIFSAEGPMPASPIGLATYLPVPGETVPPIEVGGGVGQNDGRLGLKLFWRP